MPAQPIYSRAVDPAAWTEGTLPAWPLFGYYVLTPIHKPRCGSPTKVKSRDDETDPQLARH